jgi:DNA-binding protein HU-beta
MTKSEFVRALSEKSGLTIKDAGVAVDAFIDVVTETLKNGEEVTLTGFGSFSITKRSARTGMNFATKKAVEIPASNGVRFKVGKNLKGAVN